MGYSPDNQTLFYIIIVAFVVNILITRWYCDSSSKKHIKTITKKINNIFDQYATKQYQSNQSKQPKQTMQADSIDDPAEDIDT
jgi:hypothetical protein